MMKTIRRIPNQILSLFAVLSFLSSCQDDIDLNLDPQETKKLVTDAVLTDDYKTHVIRLTETTNYYDPKAVPVVSGADVTIASDSGTITFVESSHPDSTGYYESAVPFSAKAGMRHELAINYEGETYTAESTVRQVPDIDSVSFELSPFSTTGLTQDTIIQVNMHYFEPAPAGEHYLINVYVNGELISDTPQDKPIYDDEGVEGEIMLGVYNLTYNEDVFPGDTVTVQLGAISEQAFEFYNVYTNQTDLSGNPFSGAPPANIPTNMSEGAIGFFEIQAVSRHTGIFVSL